MDTNNDTRVDTIDVFVTNSGTTGDTITEFDFSQMSKNWVLSNIVYPVEIEPLVFEKHLLLLAVTNHDQITLEDDIHIDVYLASKGSINPAIVIENKDLLESEEEEYIFQLKEMVSYDYLIDPHFDIFYFHPEFFIRIIFTSVISFLPLTIYIVNKFSRGKIKRFQRKNKIMDE